MQDTLSHEVPFLLTEWGRWARQRVGISLGHARMRQPSDLRGGGLPSPLISDECALWVDMAVSQVTPQRARDALVLAYCIRASNRGIGRELGCSHNTAKVLIGQGEAQVGEALGG